MRDFTPTNLASIPPRMRDNACTHTNTRTMHLLDAVGGEVPGADAARELVGHHGAVPRAAVDVERRALLQNLVLLWLWRDGVTGGRWRVSQHSFGLCWWSEMRKGATTGYGSWRRPSMPVSRRMRSTALYCC